MFIFAGICFRGKNHKTSLVIAQTVYINKLEIMRFYTNKFLMLLYHTYPSVNLKLYVRYVGGSYSVNFPKKKVIARKSPLQSVEHLGLFAQSSVSALILLSNAVSLECVGSVQFQRLLPNSKIQRSMIQLC